MLVILFSTAPLFVGFTLYKPTQALFDRWLGAITGYALLMIFVSSILGIALSIAQWSIIDSYLDHARHITLVGFVPSMVVGFIGVGIILSAARLAQSIGGTVTTSSATNLLANTMGQAASSAIASARPLTQRANRARRLHRDLWNGKAFDAIGDRFKRATTKAKAAPTNEKEAPTNDNQT